MAIITLTTDFGLADGYVGAMKGVILGIAPHAQMVDVSHDIPPQGVRQASYVLARVAPFFPPGTVHLAVVDPGVGGSRHALLITTPEAAFVGPDNGLLTFALDMPGARAWQLDRPEFWLPTISHTFHGRDIFASVAAHLASGISAEQLGSPLQNPELLQPLLAARQADGAIIGNVIYVDHFGNLITNVPGEWLATNSWTGEIAGQRVLRALETYALAEPGELVFLVNSGGTVEIALRDGDAARRLHAGEGAVVHMWPTNL